MMLLAKNTAFEYVPVT